MLAGVLVVAVVEQGDGVVVALFVAGEGGRALGDLQDAGVDVHADAVGEIGGAGGEHLVEGGVRLVVLACLHQVEGGFVEREGFCARASSAGGGTLRRGCAECALRTADGCGLRWAIGVPEVAVTWSWVTAYGVRGSSA